MASAHTAAVPPAVKTRSARASAKTAAERAGELFVRRALRSDQRPLEFFFDTALRKDYFVRRGQLAEILTGRNHRVYVAELDAVLVGVAILTKGARLVNALVHPAYRGLGIGRALIEQSGAREVRAKIDMSTGDSRGFYRALGFAPTGRFNARQNVELMRKPVQSGNGRTPSAQPASRRRANGKTRSRTKNGK